MTEPTRGRRRGRGRPSIDPDGATRRRLVRLPPWLDDAAARLKGRTGWSEWIRSLIEERVRRAQAETVDEPASLRDIGRRARPRH